MEWCDLTFFVVNMRIVGVDENLRPLKGQVKRLNCSVEIMHFS